MKNTMMSLVLLATLTTIALAGEVKKGKVKAAAKTKAKTECPMGASHSCCMKRAQV